MLDSTVISQLYFIDIMKRILSISLRRNKLTKPSATTGIFSAFCGRFSRSYTSICFRQQFLHFLPNLKIFICFKKTYNLVMEKLQSESRTVGHLASKRKAS